MNKSNFRILRSILTASFALALTIGASAGDSHSGHSSKAASKHQNAASKTGAAKVGKLVIDNAWTRQAPPSAKVVGGYARITNTGSQPDRLIGGTASFAKRVEVHDMKVTDGVMKMTALPQGLVIPPGESVELRPGSFHLMFMGATSPKAGETVPITLKFEKAGEVVVQLPVSPIGSKSGSTGHGSAHGQKKHGS